MRYFKFTAENNNGLFNINKGDEVVVCLNKKLNSNHVNSKFRGNSEIRDLLWENSAEYIKSPTSEIIKSVDKELSSHLNYIT